MANILKTDFMKEIMETSYTMYRHGWNEYNGGNLSYLLTEKEAKPFAKKIIRYLPLPEPMPCMAGRYLVITGTGKFFANVMKKPDDCLGLIRIVEDGGKAELYWGFSGGGTFTSEITLHLGAHAERLKITPDQRVIMHAHPANVITLTHLRGNDGDELTKELWRTCTEVVALVPRGVALIPWMVSSSVNLGLITAKSFSETNVVIWQLHGMTVAAESLENALGLFELIEKMAGICLAMDGKKELSPMRDDMLLDIVNALKVNAKTEILNTSDK